MPIIPVEQLTEIADSVNKLIRILSFDWDRGFIYMEYEPSVIHPPGSDTRTDIEKLLDSIAYDSDLLHMPERAPDDWVHQRTLLSEEELEQLNSFRSKFGMPDA